MPCPMNHEVKQMRSVIGLSVALATVFNVGIASAATGSIESIAGKVTIEHNGAAVVATSGSNIQDGDRVIVAGKSSAVVNYGGLCKATLEPGSTVISPALCPPASTGQVSESTSLTPLLLIGGAAAIGGVVALAGSNGSGGASN